MGATGGWSCWHTVRKTPLTLSLLAQSPNPRSQHCDIFFPCLSFLPLLPADFLMGVTAQAYREAVMKPLLCCGLTLDIIFCYIFFLPLANKPYRTSTPSPADTHTSPGPQMLTSCPFVPWLYQSTSLPRAMHLRSYC